MFCKGERKTRREEIREKERPSESGGKERERRKGRGEDRVSEAIESCYRTRVEKRSKGKATVDRQFRSAEID